MLFSQLMRRAIACAVFGVLICGVAQPVWADLSLMLEPSSQTFTAGTATTGFFDVYLTSDATSADPDTISGYAVEIDLTSSGTGITFPASNYVSEDTTAPDGNLFGAETDIQPHANFETTISYTDFPTDSQPESIFSGSTYGAGRIFFEISADATPGVYTLLFDPSSNATAFLDGSGSAANFAGLMGATITIAPAAIPEPSTALLFGLSGAMGLIFTRRRRRKGTLSV